MDREDIQRRRADNQIWNGAGSYGVRAEFCAFDPDGTAELYFNTVIGLVSRYYDTSKLRPLFNTFQSQPNGELYTDLFWLGLEGAAYRRGVEERPVLAELRREYAEGVVDTAKPAASRADIMSLRAAWFARALGQTAKEDEWTRGVLDELTFPPELTEAQICERMEALLYKYFRRARRSITDRQWAAWVDRDFDGKGRRSGRLISRNALRRLAQNGGGEAQTKEGRAQRALLLLQGRTPESILRRYVEDVFGVSMLTPSQLAEAERELCTGAHKNCRLHFTRGVPPGRGVGEETAHDIKSFTLQREKNRAYFNANLVQNRLIIAQLAQRLQNTILLQRDENESVSRAGTVAPALAWRGSALGDERIFTKRTQSELGELSVDILLDGSASQNRQQEKLAAQAYIIAESLTRCRIPARVSAFCSLSGCTVVRVLRDYGEDGKNDAIFDYVSAGWNRDGLALRAVGWLMRKTRSDRKLLIMLSDANPNDDEKIPRAGLLPGGRVYGGKAGIEDTKREAAALRRAGIAPVCVFTGSDAELDGARQIYGRNLTRIPSVGWFADAVARLIIGEIKGMTGE